ncbi:MAG TPA: methylamine utilization protein [Microscillaceae bacterium]|nr:methylamine utilization protein [Microscillaceae bacterium]
MKLSFRFTLLFFVLLLVFGGAFIGCKTTQNDRSSQKASVFDQLKAIYMQDLSQCIGYLDSLQRANQKTDLQKYYRLARRSFKHLEPVLGFTDVENYKFLNQPNILKVEEEDPTDIKIKQPAGFQVLEEQIFADDIDVPVVQKNALLTKQRLKMIQKNVLFKNYQNYHFLWLLRDAIARVALTGITGFDSPVLENSLTESKWIYQRLQDYLKIFAPTFKDQQLFTEWNQAIQQSMLVLQGDFNAFDRYAFIQQHTHPQLDLWKKTVVDWQVEFPFELAIRNDASSLFSNHTFNMAYFSDAKLGANDKRRATLGKLLFNDPRLSANKQMSCATCHQENLAFSDGLTKSKGQTRNSPTLFYAALQKKFFHDGRSGSLEDQIVAVVKNKTEFHTDLKTIAQFINQTPVYKKQFEALYQKEANTLNITHAIASYVRSLTPFNSKFDRNINQQENTFTAEEKLGFNLFMGKAKCATCHFPPAFNGTVPPNFKETELEMLGTPEKPDTANAHIDPDLGRYHMFKTAERKFFFKTPTIRNIAKTAPYMHNGTYKNLEAVIDFYNRGGGAGIGIDQPLQTLPPDPLNLTSKEQKALVVFMQSLTDLQKNKPQQ